MLMPLDADAFSGLFFDIDVDAIFFSAAIDYFRCRADAYC